MEREPLIKQAPGKELIPLIAKGDEQALAEFYSLRKHWCEGYPLIHDRCFTYGFVDDLRLDLDARLKLIPAMASIAVNEDARFLHCALDLLAHLIPDDKVVPRPAGFGEAMLQLRERAVEQREEANLRCTWETLVTRARCLRPEGPDPSYVPIPEFLLP
jgi:hypothetical protein